MYCPKCKSEYRDGILICPDCKEQLVKQIIEDNYEKLEAMNPIKVASVANEIEAELIINLLKESNIPSFKKSKATGGYMNIYMGYSVFGEDIYVDKNDYEKTIDLLNDLQTEKPLDEEINQINSHIPFYRKPQIVARILLFILVGTMIMTVILNAI